MSNNKLEDFGRFFKEKHGEDFYNRHLRDFINAKDEQARIAMISADPKVQKMQLQIAVGVSHYETTRMTQHAHSSPELTLQAELISRLKNDPNNLLYLSSMLRDFVIRPCDTGQVPAPEADKTIKLFIDAGVNPYIDYLDTDYESPGFNQTGAYSGRTLPEIVGLWLQHGQGLSRYEQCKLMHDELLKAQAQPVMLTKEQLFQILVTTGGNLQLIKLPSSTTSSSYDQQRIKAKAGQKIVDKLLAAGVTVETLPELVLKVQNQLNEKSNNSKDQKAINVFARQLRRATALVMEGTYLKEHQRELKYLQSIIICIKLAPLIIPIFIAVILAIIRAVIMRNTKYSVKAQEHSLSKFISKLTTEQQSLVNHEAPFTAYDTIKQSLDPKFPVEEQIGKRHIKDAVLTRPIKSSGKNQLNIFNSLFEGQSAIWPEERGSMDKMVRVYSSPAPKA